MDTIKIENKAVKMVAHRGLSGIEKENTCSAFVAACNRATYFAVETDVHRTPDSYTKRELVGAGPLHLATQDRSVA